MEKKTNIIFIIVLSLLIISVCLGEHYRIVNKYKSDTISIIKSVDTVYNKVVLDSINYNIHIKDSTIVKLKKKIEYETEQAINANDSNAIKQFYELAGAD